MHVKRHVSFQEKQHVLLEGDVSVLAQMPNDLLRRLHVQSRQPVLVGSLEFFRKFVKVHPHVMRSICHGGMSEARFHCGEKLFRSGDASAQALFVDKGLLHYEQSQAGTEAITVAIGTCVSEPGLWLSNWLNRGDLLAVYHGLVYTLTAKNFTQVVSNHPETNKLVASYVRMFVEDINMNDVAALSDLRDHMYFRTKKAKLKESSSFVSGSPSSSVGVSFLPQKWREKLSKLAGSSSLAPAEI